MYIRLETCLLPDITLNCTTKAFLEKKKIISDNSKAVILNIDVLDKESWTIADIQARARRLSSIVMKRYKIDKVEDDKSEFD